MTLSRSHKSRCVFISRWFFPHRTTGNYFYFGDVSENQHGLISAP